MIRGCVDLAELFDGVLRELSEKISEYDLGIEEVSSEQFKLFSLVDDLTVDDLIRQDVYVMIGRVLLDRLGVEPNDVRYDFKNWILANS